MQHRGIVSRRFLFMIDHASEEDIHLATRRAGKRIGAIVDVALALVSLTLARSFARRSIGISKSRTYVRMHAATCVRARARAREPVCTCSGRQP